MSIFSISLTFMVKRWQRGRMQPYCTRNLILLAFPPDVVFEIAHAASLQISNWLEVVWKVAHSCCRSRHSFDPCFPAVILDIVQHACFPIPFLGLPWRARQQGGALLLSCFNHGLKFFIHSITEIRKSPAGVVGTSSSGEKINWARVVREILTILKSGCRFLQQKFLGVHVVFLSVESFECWCGCFNNGCMASTYNNKSREGGEPPAIFPSAHTASSLTSSFKDRSKCTIIGTTRLPRWLLCAPMSLRQYSLTHKRLRIG